MARHQNKRNRRIFNGAFGLWWRSVQGRKKRRLLIKRLFRRKKRRLKQMGLKTWKLMPKKKKKRAFDRKRAWERSTAKSIRGLKQSLVRVEEQYFGNVSVRRECRLYHWLCSLCPL